MFLNPLIRILSPVLTVIKGYFQGGFTDINGHRKTKIHEAAMEEKLPVGNLVNFSDFCA
jgi:hypothetical protein